jgi:hypothetical protein
MKKSEMGHKLREFLLSCNYEQFIANDANGIIDFLVDQGMQPPAYEKLVEAKGIASPSPDLKLYYKLPCNEWEPEND